jgi:hypothetical protein
MSNAISCKLRDCRLRFVNIRFIHNNPARERLNMPGGLAVFLSAEVCGRGYWICGCSVIYRVQDAPIREPGRLKRIRAIAGYRSAQTL